MPRKDFLDIEHIEEMSGVTARTQSPTVSASIIATLRTGSREARKNITLNISGGKIGSEARLNHIVSPSVEDETDPLPTSTGAGLKTAF